jgi:hypothetical protein
MPDPPGNVQKSLNDASSRQAARKQGADKEISQDPGFHLSTGSLDKAMELRSPQTFEEKR